MNPTAAASEQLRLVIENLAEDAWNSWPSSDMQDRELWACVWGDGDGILGSTIAASPTRERLRVLANKADCWWTWDEYGEPNSMTLAAARDLFGEAGGTLEPDPLVRVARIWLRGDVGLVTAQELAGFIRAQRDEFCSQCKCSERTEADPK